MALEIMDILRTPRVGRTYRELQNEPTIYPEPKLNVFTRECEREDSNEAPAYHDEK